MGAEFQFDLNKRVYEAKEQLLRGIMAQVLGRPPVIEDGANFQFLEHAEYPGREFIGHKEKGLLGEIVFDCSGSVENGIVVIFKFIPKTRFDL